MSVFYYSLVGLLRFRLADCFCLFTHLARACLAGWEFFFFSFSKPSSWSIVVTVQCYLLWWILLVCLLIVFWFMVQLGIGCHLICTVQYTSGFIDQLDRKTINRCCFLVATVSGSYIYAVKCHLSISLEVDGGYMV